MAIWVTASEPRTDTLELGLKWTLEMICHKNTPLTLMTPWIVGHLVTRRPLSSIFYASLRTYRGEQGFLFQSFCKRSDLRTLMLNMMFWARKSDMVTRWRRRLWGHDFEERRIKKFLFLSFNQTLSFHKALRALANTPTWREVKRLKITENGLISVNTKSVTETLYLLILM